MPSKAEDVGRAYFAAIAEHDIEAAVALWRPGGRENVRGQVDTVAPDGVREFLGGMLDAMPDAKMEVLAVIPSRDKVAIRWRATGTFSGAPLNGIEPTGAAMELEGCDVLRIDKEGLIVENDAYLDGATIARQIGMLPPVGSKQESRVTRAFNAATRAKKRLAGDGPLEDVADGVWLVRGGFPTRGMNVYLVRDGDGVLAFDAGIRQMAPAIRSAAASLGGLTRVVLGHGHADHRGSAALLGVPVECHEEERAVAEGDGGFSTFDLTKLPPVLKQAYRHSLKDWDAGPVTIDRTFKEGDDVAGFRVVHIPGHSPGMVALFRESDGVALTSDCFYTVNPVTFRHGAPMLPHLAFTPHEQQARASIAKVAALDPSIAWPGHADPVRGDVRAQLEAAARG